jgi:hypothetical protein
MLDITSALSDLNAICAPWQVHILSVKNEVKEVLLYHQQKMSTVNCQLSITAIDLPDGHPFTFTPSEEQSAVCPYARHLPLWGGREGFPGAGGCLLPLWGGREGFPEAGGCLLYEPSSSILKSGAFRLVGARYGLQKLDPNTHLYLSDRFIPDFPGRIFQIKEVCGNAKNSNCQLSIVNFRANVIARNYPLSADQLRRKYRIADGGDHYLIATRLAGKPLLLLASRLK